jgi:hypothetical protein
VSSTCARLEVRMSIGSLEFGFQMRLNPQLLRGTVEQGSAHCGHRPPEPAERCWAASSNACPLARRLWLLCKFIPFVGLGVEFFQLTDLPSQAFTLALQGVLCAFSLRARSALPPHATGGKRSRWTPWHRRRAGPARRRAGQALPGVLAVNVEQLFTHERNCWAVAGLPLIQARLLPVTSTVRRNSKVSLLSKPASSKVLWTVAGVSNSALTSVRLGSFAYDARYRTGAGYQLQRINQNGLASAGFTSQHR